MRWSCRARGSSRGVTPEELAERHPRLYHVTTPGAWPLIERHGLLPTAALLELFGLGSAQREAMVSRRRPESVPVAHPDLGEVLITDNVPLSEAALARCLEDGLTPADWLRMLNARVFFWADRGRLDGLLNARLNRGRAREVLAFDTLGLARAHAERMEISPINSGATIRKPARRGLSTFTPLLAMEYRDWQRRRGGRDVIVEVTVRDGIPDAARHLVGREVVGPAQIASPAA